MEFEHVLTNLVPSTQYQVVPRCTVYCTLYCTVPWQVRLYCANRYGVSRTTHTITITTRDIGREYNTGL